MGRKIARYKAHFTQAAWANDFVKTMEVKMLMGVIFPRTLPTRQIISLNETH
jgi:hypothetical protein